MDLQLVKTIGVAVVVQVITLLLVYLFLKHVLGGKKCGCGCNGGGGGAAPAEGKIYTWEEFQEMGR